MKYEELLKDARWQKKRLEIMQRDNFTCAYCGKGLESGVTLNVHHIYYVKNNKPWEYPNDSLITLCAECHERQHKGKPINNLKGRGIFFRDLLKIDNITETDKIVLSFIASSKDVSKLSYRKLSNELGLSLASIYNSMKRLKKFSFLNDENKVICNISHSGYFAIRTDLKHEIGGKLLIFYSWLCDRAKDNIVDAYRSNIAKYFNDKESNIHNMLQRLYKLKFVERAEYYSGIYGKLKLLK